MTKEQIKETRDVDPMARHEAIEFHLNSLAQLLGLGPFSATEDSDVDATYHAQKSLEEWQSSTPLYNKLLVDIAAATLGLDEDDHRDELMKLFAEASIEDPNGGTLNPTQTSWCGGYVDYVLFKLGLPMANSLAARDFMSVGIPVKDRKPRRGDVRVFRKHVGIVFGYSKFDKKITSMEEWADAETTDDAKGSVLMLLGGNQSDEINISPSLWYSQYSKHLGDREVYQCSTGNGLVV